MKFGRQEHAGLLPTIWHLALGPQGEGTQDAGAGDGVVLSLVIATLVHSTKGSPVIVRGHVQMGLWFLVVQMARIPQVC